MFSYLNIINSHQKCVKTVHLNPSNNDRLQRKSTWIAVANTGVNYQINDGYSFVPKKSEIL